MPGIINYCTAILKQFVSQSIFLYGNHFVTFNVHNLIHLPASVKHWGHFGPLYSHCAYPFENHLQSIKGLVVAKSKMLQQAVKRLDEMDRNLIIKKLPVMDSVFSTGTQHFNSPIYRQFIGNQYKKLTVGRLTLSISEQDNCVVLRDSRIFLIRNILETEHRLKIIYGQYFLISEDFLNIQYIRKKSMFLKLVI